jgi:tetratricopeptide (TPR) repeat protein
VLEQLLRRQIARLAPFENRLGDVRGEIAEADNPSEIGSAHSFAHRKPRKGDAIALDECRVESVRPDEQLDQSSVGFHRGERIGTADQHPDFHPCSAQPCRHGQDHGFLVEYALRRIALASLGERENGTSHLEEAVAVYRAALGEYRRDRVPLDWAMTQMNLGNALSALGGRENGAARIKEAVAAHHAALEEYKRDRVPLRWAMTQMNLGVALTVLGERESGTARLEEAVIAYAAALEEYRRDRFPIDWATCTGGQGITLMLIADRVGDAGRGQTAVEQIELALALMRQVGDESRVTYYEAELRKAKALLDRLAGRG